MTAQQFKKASILYFTSGILCMITLFWGIFYAASMDKFHITFLFAVLAGLFIISLIAFMWFLIWSLFTKTGKGFWLFYFKKRGLLDSPMFKGREPADVMKGMLLFVIIVVASAVLIN